ncbi:hepatic lectin [Procambarus clarkii]|uniref:hepatic lectin n=1 Tax=Procambarus clarkii TaxID=6728 RepID=UPI0037426EAE
MKAITTLLFLLGCCGWSCHATTLYEQVKNQNKSACLSPFVSVGGRCLMFDMENQDTWEEMRQVCQALHADLAKVDSADLLADIVDYIHVHDLPATFYVGGRYKEVAGEWQWVDGTKVRMGTPSWYPYDDGTQEPSEASDAYCIIIYRYRQYYLASSMCTNLFSAICEAT